jgi:protoporphyrinogen oxidase
LLLAKLGENYKRVSAVFIWSYIKRLFSARDSSASKEHLGHVAGGYRQVFDTVQKQLGRSNCNIFTGVSVESFRAASGGGIELTVAGEERPRHYQKLICTSPVPVLRKLADDALLTVHEGSGDVEYLGVVCVVLVTTVPVVPYYVVNIADEQVPFTGIIGMSKVVDPNYTGNRFLTYLPKYVLSTSEWMSRSDADIRVSFMAGLRRMIPEFDDSIVERVVVNRAARVQPLQVREFSKIVPDVKTRHPDFFVLNTAQFLNATLNNNEVIRAVDEFVESHRQIFDARAAIA